MKKRTIIRIVLVVFIAVGIVLAVTLKNRRSGENGPSSENNVTIDSTDDLNAFDPSSTMAGASVDTSNDVSCSSDNQDTIASTAETRAASDRQSTATNRNNDMSSESDDMTDSDNVRTSLANRYDSDLPAFIIDSVETSPGAEDVEVEVRIVNNPGVLGTTMILNYDDSVLDLKKAENGDAFSTLNYAPPKQLANGCIFTWYGESLGKEDISDGTVLSLHFGVSRSVSEGSFSVAITGFNGNTYDSELSELKMDVLNGFINVK